MFGLEEGRFPSTVVKVVDCKLSVMYQLPVTNKGLPVSEDDDSRWWSFEISVFGHKITDMTHNDGQQHHCSISGAGYSSRVYFKGRNEQPSNMRISSMCALSERMWLHHMHKSAAAYKLY